MIDGKEQLIELDKKLLKFFILVIKNDYKYFEDGGKYGYRYWYDKIQPLLTRITNENKIAFLNVYADMYIYMTSKYTFSIYIFYPIDKNAFRTDYIIVNKDGLWEIRLNDERYQVLNSYDFLQIVNAINDTPEKITYYDSLDNSNDIIAKMYRFVDFVKNAN
jgi:hypothetical protein